MSLINSESQRILILASNQGILIFPLELCVEECDREH